MARILVVDDRAVNRDYIVSLLSYLGHDVKGAVDGEDALAQIAQRLPDLVITDLLMPGIDGEQLAAALQANAATAGLPIIFLTAAYHSREAWAIAERVGVRHVLAKPAQPQDVVALVQQVLGESSDENSQQAPAGPSVGRLQMFGALDTRLSALLDNQQAEPAVAGVDQESRSLVLRLNALARVGVDLATVRQPRALGETFARAVQDILGARWVGVVIQSADDTAIRGFFSRGLSVEQAVALSVPLATCTAARLLQGSAPKAEPVFAEGTGAAGLPDEHPPVQAVVSSVIPGYREVCGWVYAADRLGGEPFSADDGLLLSALASQFGLAWEALALYEALDLRVAERTRALDAANRQMESVAHALAHDLRQPLLSIGGYAGLAARGVGPADSDTARYLQRVLANASRMSEMIESLLGFSQLARQASGRELVDVNEVVQRSLADLLPEIEVRGITVNVEHLPAVEAHPSLLEELLRQLLRNAVKFTREADDPRIDVGVVTHSRQGKAYFVRDNGIGFNANRTEQVQALFEPSGRRHLANEAGSTGMGLAIAYRIAAAHGGHLWADSTPGQGATLYFKL